MAWFCFFGWVLSIPPNQLQIFCFGISLTKLDYKRKCFKFGVVSFVVELVFLPIPLTWSTKCSIGGGKGQATLLLHLTKSLFSVPQTCEPWADVLRALTKIEPERKSPCHLANANQMVLISFLFFYSFSPAFWILVTCYQSLWCINYLCEDTTTLVCWLLWNFFTVFPLVLKYAKRILLQVSLEFVVYICCMPTTDPASCSYQISCSSKLQVDYVSIMHMVHRLNCPVQL